jgi:hypothetical protein
MTYRPQPNQKFDWSDHEMIQQLVWTSLDPVLPARGEAGEIPK